MPTSMMALPRAGLAIGWLASALAAGMVGAWPGAAAAEEEAPFTIGASPAWFLLGGVTSGATLVEEGGGFLGGELSLVRLRDGRFAGLYADSYYDFGAGATYVSVGPELGLHFRSSQALPLSVGVDGGLALRLDGETDAGPAGRLSITLFGMLSVYGRYVHLLAGDDEQAFQAGVALKFPLISPLGGGISEE